MAEQPKAYLDMEPGFFSGGQTVVVNGKELSRSFWSPGRYDIAEQMKDNPRAFEFAEKHEEYAKWSGMALWGGVGGAITYLIADRDNVNYGVYWGIFSAGFVSSIVLQKASIGYLYKAVNAYNGVDSTKTS